MLTNPTYPSTYVGQYGSSEGVVIITYYSTGTASWSNQAANGSVIGDHFAYIEPVHGPVLRRCGFYPRKVRRGVNPCAAAGVPPQPPPVSLALCAGAPHHRPAPPRRRLQRAFRGPWKEGALRPRRPRRRRIRVWERGENA